MRIDTTKPSPARIYDYVLGGNANYEVDRQVAGMVLEEFPEARDAAVSNRRFLVKATQYNATNRGIRQFLDLGSGLPTQKNVHEVAQADAPDACVVYVDNDPSVLLHAKSLLLENDPRTRYVQGDVMTPAEIITDPVTQELINFERPVAVFLVAVLHFVRDENDPRGIVKTLMDQVPSGSTLTLSHFTTDGMSDEVSERIQRQNEQLAVPLNPRSGKDIRRFFDGLDLVEPPGFCFIEQWAPGETLPADETAPLKLLCGVAVKP